MKIEWSPTALADLDRFARFLHDKFPTLAGAVAEALIQRSIILAEYPFIGHPLLGLRTIANLCSMC